MKKKTTFITTPIYYSSGKVHIGNSYTTIACDCLARFKRLKGNDTFYLTGMDEHGQKIQEAAKAKSITPQQLTDEIAQETQDLWERLKISHDYFVRTTDLVHMEVVQNVFEKLLKNDDIYLGTYEGDYCVSCETHYSKSEIVDNLCPDCGKPLRKVSEECYFLRLSKYQDKLLKHIENNPDCIQPESRKNEVVSFVESGLEDLAVSRTTFTWGVSVLSNPKHVVYVWIDALVNYISSLNYSKDDNSLFIKYWENGDEIIHVLGKDILRFHAVIWPIVLMCLDIPVKCKLMIHGWILVKDGKMSKSFGNVVYPDDVISKYGLDSLRYFLLRELPLGNDAVFTYERFLERHNFDLCNDLGNLQKRSITMINKYFNGSLEEVNTLESPFSLELKKVLEEEINNTINYFDNFRLQLGLISIWNIIKRANKYIDETTPWVVANDAFLKKLLNEIMYLLYEVLRNVSILLTPVIIETSTKMKKELNLTEDDSSFNSLGFRYSKAVSVSNSEVLFIRYDIPKELESLEKKPLKVKDLVTIDDFEKIDLRVGKVIECSKIEKSDKLLLLQVKIEEEVRQIVSGISLHYSEKEMIGKYVVVVANLKPVVLRGYESNGMILAASSDKNSLEVLELKKEKEFAKVK